MLTTANTQTAASAPATQPLTFWRLVELWVADNKDRLKAKSIHETMRLVVREVPDLAHMPAEAITRSQVREALNRLSPRPGIRKTTHAAISRVYGWAVAQGHCDQNPITGLRSPKPKARERVLSEAEIRCVWHAVEGMGDYARIVRLLLCTGQRRVEVGSVRWDEIEMEAEGGPALVLKGERVKNGRTHAVPLTPLALEQLPSERRWHGHLFGNGGEGFAGWSGCKAILDRRIAGMPEWVPHDLRRTVASNMARLGVALPVVEKVLNHQSGTFSGVQGVYQRYSFAKEKCEALALWSAELKRIVGDGRPELDRPTAEPFEWPKGLAERIRASGLLG